MAVAAAPMAFAPMFRVVCEVDFVMFGDTYLADAREPLVTDFKNLSPWRKKGCIPTHFIFVCFVDRFYVYGFSFTTVLS